MYSRNQTAVAYINFCIDKMPSALLANFVLLYLSQLNKYLIHFNYTYTCYL